MESYSFSGRRIAVIGASRGLGAAIAEKLAGHNAVLWLFSRSDTDLAAVAESCRSDRDNGSHVRWLTCDISDAAAIKQAASEVQKKWGNLDALVINAGVWLEGDLEANSAADISKLISTNLTGPILVTKEFLPLLRRGKAPMILYVGSLAATEPGPDWPVYTASKYGLGGFTESIGPVLEKEGIRVTQINPGGIDTYLYVSAGYPGKVHQPWMMQPDRVADTAIEILAGQNDGRISRVDIRKFGLSE